MEECGFNAVRRVVDEGYGLVLGIDFNSTEHSAFIPVGRGALSCPTLEHVWMVEFRLASNRGMSASNRRATNGVHVLLSSRRRIDHLVCQHRQR